MQSSLRCSTAVAGALVAAYCLVCVCFAATGGVKGADVLERSRAVYSNLGSYEDSGVVISEFGASSREKHHFATRFSRTPRGFMFDFKKAGGDRYVIWGDPHAFHVWWKTTGATTEFPNPNNVGAFALADAPSLGAALKIPALLYAKASLPGAFLHFVSNPPTGRETLDSRTCYLVTGTTRDIYGGTGNAVNVRNMRVWIDVETFLVRKVVEEWAPLPGQVNRRTTFFEPRANPALPASDFLFSPTKLN